MRITLRAAHFGPLHPVTRIGVLDHLAMIGRLVEAGPAGPGIVLRLGIEQRLAADHAVVRPWIFRLPVFPRERRLGTRLLRYVILLGRELLLQLRLAFHDLLCHGHSISTIYVNTDWMSWTAKS